MSDISTKHVFIVDNGKVYVNLLRYIFSKDFSFRFLSFRSGNECIENLNLNPEIVVINYALPDISGLEVIKEVRRQHPHIYILVLLSDHDEKLPSELFEAGADDYVLKEATGADSVAGKIESYLSRENLSQTLASKVNRLAMKQVYYLLLALAAFSAGVYYYQ